MELYKRLEKTLYDGLLNDRLIHKSWRIKLTSIDKGGYQYTTAHFDVYKFHGRKPVGHIDAVLDTFKITLDVSNSGAFWLQWEKELEEAIKKDIYADFGL